jgi:hypothetical protein
MEGIRALAPGDLHAAARLIERTLPSHAAGAGDVAGFLDRTLMRPPWHDPESPSLVYERANGEIAGLIGVASRRLRLDGEPIRAVYCAHLSLADARRDGWIGGLLLLNVLRGPQALSVTDTANVPVRTIWDSLRGRADELRSIGWIQPLRIATTAAVFAPEVMPAPGWLLEAAKPIARAADGVLRSRRRRLAAGPPGVEWRDASAAEISEAASAVLDGYRLTPCYDADYLASLLASMRAELGERIRARIVRRDGSPIGWYVCRRDPEGVLQVLELVAARGEGGAVLGALVADAARAGSTAVKGRLDPLLLETVAAAGCAYHVSHRVLVHARSAEMMALATSSQALLTRVAGEWW